MRKESKILILMIALMQWSAFAFGAETDASERSSPTIYLRAGGGFHSFKSELLESNDTGTTIDFSLGVYAGEKREIGIIFENQTTSTKFTLNDATQSQTFQDIHLRYRLGWFHLGAVIANMTMTAKNDTANLDLDLVGSGYGGNVGWVLGFLRNNAWYFDANFVSISEIRDANQTDVTMGSRLDLDSGVSFFVTREILDVIFGYKKRTYSIKTDASANEAQDTTYLALRFNLFF